MVASLPSAEVLKFAGARPRDMTVRQKDIAYKFGRQRQLSTTGAEVIANGIDVKSMSFPAVISTIEIDRVGDCVVPKGCILTGYELNSPVFLNHQQVAIPLGISHGPDDRLYVALEEARVLARCFCIQTGKYAADAADIFHLIELKAFNGTSIGFNPDPDPRYTKMLDTGGQRFERWELLEWSVVGIPCNKYATIIRKMLTDNRITNKTISPVVRKFLEPHAEPAPIWAKSGYDAAALQRAKAADLVTLPAKDKGTICGNCEYVTTKEGRDYCKNEQVDQVLVDGKDRMCCALWDAPGTKRAWEKGGDDVSKKYGKTRPVPARQTAKQPVQAEKIIRHEGGKWVLYSHEGKVLGRHDSEEDAKKQEAAIEAHKHGDKAMGEGSGTEGGYAVPEEEEKAESATQECVSSKMPKLVEGGHDQDQAAAIAYSECGEKKKAFPAAAEKDEEEDDKESEEGTEETPAAEDEGAEEKPAAEDESSEEEAPANEEAPPEESALDKPALEGKPQANAPAKPDAAGQPPPFGAPEAATPEDSDAESVDAASQPAARAESVYAQDLTDERRPGGVELFQRLIESAESELAALEPEAKVAVEQAIEALRNLAEQRYPDEDFGGVEPEEMSPTGSVAQPNPAEEAEEAAVTQNILDRYKDHQPSQQKCSGRGTMSKYQKSKRYAAAIVKAAADHMHGFRKLIGKKYGEDEHEETHDHARALDHLHGVLTKGDPDADEDEDERDEHDERVHDDHDDGDHDADDEAQDERESFRPSHEDHPYEHKDALEDEKGIDWSAINDALKPLRERVDRLDKVSSSLLSLTGKN